MKNDNYPNISIGQILYREKSNRNSLFEIEEFEVSKIGKKYFYLKGLGERFPIRKETLTYECKNYTQHNFKLYKTKQEILDNREKYNLINKLRKHLDWTGDHKNNSLDQLRAAATALCLLT